MSDPSSPSDVRTLGRFVLVGGLLSSAAAGAGCAWGGWRLGGGWGLAGGAVLGLILAAAGGFGTVFLWVLSQDSR